MELENKKYFKIFKQKLLENKNELLDMVSEEISYKILYSRKYKLVYDYDPYYDSSGQLIDTGKSFNVDDYERVYDFLEEYNGDQTPTYMSGYGLHSVSHSDDIYTLVQEFSGKIIADIFYEGLKNDKDFKFEEPYDIHELIFDDITLLELDILEEIDEMSIDEVYKHGLFMAKRRREEEIKEENERRCIRMKNLEASSKLVDKLRKLYQESFGSEFVKMSKEDKNHYSKFREILNSNFTSYEVQLLGEYQSHLFSNSLASEMSRDFQK